MAADWVFNGKARKAGKSNFSGVLVMGVKNEGGNFDRAGSCWFGFFRVWVNPFLHFIPAVLPADLGGQFLNLLFQSHYVLFVGGVQVAGGALLLINRYVPLALTLLGPVIVNILLYHLLLSHAGAGLAVIVAILWGFLFYRYRQNFASLFMQKAC